MKFFQILPQNLNLDFIGKFKYFMAFSVLVAIGVTSLIFTRGFNYGIDFTGGTVLQLEFKKQTSSEEVRKIFDELGEHDASIVSLGTANTEFLITTRKATDVKNEVAINKKIMNKLGDAVVIKKMDVVGPKVGAELKTASIRALFYSIVLIAIYIWFRFDIRFAPGATIAMLHDLLMASGFYLLTGREFTITAVAALLTIAGYSVNDTIVIYDRVRENLKKAGGQQPLPKTINNALNQTLSRTILTSLVTLLSVIPIIFFTTGELQSFAMVMCFGIFVGTYSTVYIASPFTIYVEKFLERKNKSIQKGKVVTI